MKASRDFMVHVRQCALAACLATQISGVSAVSAGHHIASDYLVQNWTTGDGLPNNSVRSILETQDGYLWVATAHGVARFDGVRFKSLNSVNTPSLISDNVLQLLQDSSGAIWMRTVREILRYEDGIATSEFTYDSSSDYPNSKLVKDQEGKLWFASGKGFYSWDGQRFQGEDAPQGPLGIRFMVSSSAGSWWISATNGLWRMQDKQARLVVSTNLPAQIVVDSNQRVWGIVQERFLYALEEKRWEQRADFGPIRCRTLWRASNGDLWVGARSRYHVFRWRDGEIDEFNETHGLDGNRAICFNEDREGNVWLGMNGAGLYQLREKRLKLFNQDDGLVNLSLSSVTEDAEAGLIVNIMGWSPHRYVSNRFESVNVVGSAGPRYEYPTALVPAREGGVWSGAFYGQLARIQNGRVVEWIGSDNGTRCLFVDRRGDLWRGTRTGGAEYFSENGIQSYSTANGLSSDNVYAFTEDAEGAIWIGTDKGLNRVREGSIAQYGSTNGLPHPFVSALWTDSLNTVWVGTRGGGLSAWTASEFVTLTTKEGLPDDNIQQLLEDDLGFLWIGTRLGLMRIGLAELHRWLDDRSGSVTGTLIGRNEGLPRPDCSTEYQPANWKDDRGHLWFCTSSGLVLIDPRRFSKPSPPPIVHIEELSVDGSIIRPSIQASTVLPAGSERLEFRFTGLSPSDPDLVRFRYQLGGYDRDWVEAGFTRFAHYAYLDPGRYTFRVQAANNDGLWNLVAQSWTFRIQPAFWQTSWFRALMLIAVLSSCGGIVYWRLNLLERRRLAQESFSRQLIEFQEAERKRIASELHDGLGQNLLVIRTRAGLALASKERPEEMASMLEEVASVASSAIREVRGIAHDLRPFQIDELGLTKAISAMVRKLQEASSIEFVTNLENVDGAIPAELEINVYRIAQECLNNVIRHAHADVVSVSLTRDHRYLRLAVTDNGSGLTSRAQADGETPGFGLKSMKERARAMRGDVQFSSPPEGGFRVELLVPLD